MNNDVTIVIKLKELVELDLSPSKTDTGTTTASFALHASPRSSAGASSLTPRTSSALSVQSRNLCKTALQQSTLHYPLRYTSSPFVAHFQLATLLLN